MTMETSDISKLKIDSSRRRPTGPGSGRRLWIWLVSIIVLACVVVGVLGWLGLLRPRIPVQTVKASKSYVSRALAVLNASGYVAAQRRAAVSSKATGRLARLYVEEGKAIKQGEIIAELENRDLEATLEEARAARKEAEALLMNAEAELADATANYRRIKALRQSGAVSEQAYDSAEARYNKAMAVHSSMKFSLERARATVKVAEVNLEYSYIRAPFDGVILTKNADEGEVVAPFGGALNAKAAVVTMADMSSLMVEADVSESSLEKVKPGGACEIRLDALPGDRFPGIVHMIVPTADRSKATVLTKIRFDTLDPRVLPEMSAKAAFLSRPLHADEHEPFVGIPESAVRNSPESKSVFILDNGRARRVSVTVGRKWGETVEILSGIGEGDSVIVKPPENLKNGDRVKAVE